MQVLQKIYFLAAFIGFLGISSCARTNTSTQAQVDKSVPTQQPEANKQIGATTPVEAADEAKEREGEAQDKQVPTALTNVGNYGEALYDTAKAGDWTKATANLRLLQQVAGSLPAEITQKDLAQLKLTTANLDKSITAKNKSITLSEANQITLIAARMTQEFKSKVPVEITLLDYYGREFEILSASGNTAQLTKTAAEFQQTWNTLRPAIQDRKSSEATTFDAIAAKIQAAKSPTDYGRLATPVLDAVDKLEKVFL